MQKNKLILILGIGMILTPLFMIQAATTPTPLKPEDQAKIDALRASLIKETKVMKTNLGTSRAEIEKQLASTKSSTKKILDIKAQDRINILIEKIFSKFNTKIDKITQVDTKISSKLNTFEKEKKVDVSKAKEQYIIAKKSLDKTIADILATKMIITEQVTKEISKETIRTLVKSLEEEIKSTASEYRKILPLIAQSNDEAKGIEKN